VKEEKAQKQGGAKKRGRKKASALTVSWVCNYARGKESTKKKFDHNQQKNKPQTERKTRSFKRPCWAKRKRGGQEGRTKKKRSEGKRNRTLISPEAKFQNMR